MMQVGVWFWALFLPKPSWLASSQSLMHRALGRAGVLSLGWESWPQTANERRNGGGLSEAELASFLGLCSSLLGSDGALSSQPGHGASLLAQSPLASGFLVNGCLSNLAVATRKGKEAVLRSTA